jgi:phage shock protein C
MNGKKLSKSATDRRISGVAGGLAEYFEVDSTLVRLLFVVFTLAGGPGLLLYIILSLVLPEADEYDSEAYQEFKSKRKREEA